MSRTLAALTLALALAAPAPSFTSGEIAPSSNIWFEGDHLPLALPFTFLRFAVYPAGLGLRQDPVLSRS